MKLSAIIAFALIFIQTASAAARSPIKKTNKFISLAYDELRQCTDDLFDFEILAEDFHQASSEYSKSMQVLLNDHYRLESLQENQLIDDAKERNLDVLDCHNEFEIKQYFLNFNRKQNILALKAEMWHFVGSNFEQLQSTVVTLRERMKEAHRDVFECEDDDQDCFQDAWAEMANVQKVAARTHDDIVSKQLAYTVMKRIFFDKWLTIIQAHADETYLDEDSALQELKDCIGQLVATKMFNITKLKQN